MPRCSPGAMKWRKHGPSSIRSKKRGRGKKISRSFSCIPPVRGDRRQPTNFWPGTDEPGGDCEMPAFSHGIAVEVGKIGLELKKLWAEGAGAKTRASLVNLAVYSEEAGSLPTNTKIISGMTEDHACRAIVIEANPASQENRV